jgi:hypothetical protein
LYTFEIIQFFELRRKVRASNITGPPPCLIGLLTTEILTAAFRQLQDPEVVSHAKEMARKMASEDGVEEAVRVFYKHLPRQALLCEVHCVAKVK